MKGRFGELEGLHACLSAADHCPHANTVRTPSLSPVFSVNTQWRFVGMNLQIYLWYLGLQAVLMMGYTWPLRIFGTLKLLLIFYLYGSILFFLWPAKRKMVLCPIFYFSLKGLVPFWISLTLWPYGLTFLRSSRKVMILKVSWPFIITGIGATFFYRVLHPKQKCRSGMPKVIS